MPQHEVSRLKVDDVVPLLIGGDEIQGKVEFVSPTADAQSGTCRVKIQIENKDLSLASGQACFLKGVEARKKETRRITQSTTRSRKLSTNLD